MNIIRSILARQFGATAQMLHESIEHCPEQIWTKELGGAAFWHLAYHTIFFLDFYLHKREADFTPAPFHRENASYLATGPSGEPYSKATLLEYLHEVRKRAQPILAELTEDDLTAPSPVPWYTIPRGEPTACAAPYRPAQHDSESSRSETTGVAGLKRVVDNGC